MVRCKLIFIVFEICNRFSLKESVRLVMYDFHRMRDTQLQTLWRVMVSISGCVVHKTSQVRLKSSYSWNIYLPSPLLTLV